MIRLQFQSTSDEEPADPTVITGQGPTALQALADLERHVTSHFGSGCFMSHLAAFSRDLDLGAIEDATEGTAFDFADFSCPEQSFILTVLP